MQPPRIPASFKFQVPAASASLVAQLRRNDMELNELTHEQKLALVGLIRTIGLANREITGPESDVIDRVASKLGDEEYRALLDEAETRFTDIAGMKTFLEGITDQSARQLIFDTARQESIGDIDIGPDEAGLIDWLAATWQTAG
jgi:hypothetical protein